MTFVKQLEVDKTVISDFIYKIICFMRSQGQYYDRLSIQELTRLVIKHYEYSTIEIYYKDYEIVAVCRYNISPTGKIIDIEDLVISGKCSDGVKIMRYFARSIMMKWKDSQYIRFWRDFKYKDRPPRVYYIEDIAREKTGGRIWGR